MSVRAAAGCVCVIAIETKLKVSVIGFYLIWLSECFVV